ncbi:hypothetical protein GGQ85_003097 [Nitrobacter vulgaris]|jgi:hypothetical protein|nr:hypothetical protein [Nitrobacter vulgaris]MDR6305375.1 hypothetical protein [Nitrobacter vulgaris]
MRKLAGLLRSLDVPLSVIADIDILNDETTFRQLFETLGGDWNEIEGDWNSLNNTVVNTRPPLTADQVRHRIQTEVQDVSGNKPFPKQVERNIRSIFQSLSPWDQIKKVGRTGFGRGAPITIFDRLVESCGTRGLWIVPVGELEGFCRTIEARHGPDFTEKVLTQRNVETDAALQEARDFVRKIWLG